MRIHRALAGALLAGGMLVASAVPAAASHVHVRALGNGQCVVLASDSGEADVQLPHTEEHAADRRHPLHVKVHLGQPGTRGGQEVVWVEGSPGDLEHCAGYVNG